MKRGLIDTMTKKTRAEMLEKDVRDPSLKHAKKYGDVLHKRMAFMKGTANGWPDDLFIFKDGHHWWVEFKRPDGEPTALQDDRHAQMSEFGVDVSVIDDLGDFYMGFDARRQLHDGTD